MALEKLLQEHPVLPRFTGSNPALWISQAERYFLFYAIYDDEQFPYVIESFDDEPFWWFNGWYRSDFFTWNDFTTAMFTQFQASSVAPDAISSSSSYQTPTVIDPVQEPIVIDSKSNATSIVAPSFTSVPFPSVLIPSVTAYKVFDDMPDDIDNDISSEVHEIIDKEILDIQTASLVILINSQWVSGVQMQFSASIFVLEHVQPANPIQQLSHATIPDHGYKAIDPLPLPAHPMTQFTIGVMALHVQGEPPDPYIHSTKLFALANDPKPPDLYTIFTVGGLPKPPESTILLPGRLTKPPNLYTTFTSVSIFAELHGILWGVVHNQLCVAQLHFYKDVEMITQSGNFGTLIVLLRLFCSKVQTAGC